MRHRTAVERFESWLSIDRGCWIWTGGKDVDGYGKFKVDGVTHRAHRWSFEYHVAELPRRLHLDHLCRTPACVNPYHLEPVTNRVNVLRGQNFIALQAAQTHCKHGHEFTDANTYIWRGARHCRKCRSLRARFSRLERTSR